MWSIVCPTCLSNNDLLPLVHSRAVGQRLLDYFVETYPKLVPPLPCPRRPPTKPYKGSSVVLSFYWTFSSSIPSPQPLTSRWCRSNGQERRHAPSAHDCQGARHSVVVAGAAGPQRLPGERL